MQTVADGHGPLFMPFSPFATRNAQPDACDVANLDLTPFILITATLIERAQDLTTLSRRCNERAAK